MSLPTDRLLEELSKLSSVQSMKTTVSCAVKSGALVGAATIVSGILGGPAGLAVGGIISSCIAGYVTQGQFQSVPYILLNETTPAQREKLAEAMRSCIKSRHITTIRDFVLALQSNQQLVEALIQILVMFLSSEMGRKVIL